MANTESPAPSSVPVAARASSPARELLADVDLRGMLIGTASAALQIEGGDDNNDWADWARRPGAVADGSTPARAADHWVRWREDNALMASLKLPVARIGVEWARIEPRPGGFDHAVLDRYRAEIGDLVDKGIRPLVTLHHFVNPRWFARRGAFTAAGSDRAFTRFAAHAVQALGDLVEEWVTVNEPNVYATQAHMFGYGPPGNASWRDTMASLRNMAAAHIRGYELIHDIQGDRAKVGFAHHARVFAPRNPRNPAHRALTRVNRRLFQDIVAEAFLAGSFHPLLGGRRAARCLPTGPHHDFLGLNYYSRTAVDKLDDGTFDGVPVNDLGWEVHPGGLVECGRELVDRYGGPVWITENGTCDQGDAALSGIDVNDAADFAGDAAADPAADRRVESFRPRFILEHLRAAAESDVPFERYYHWSFTDNWEWSDGEEPRFGAVHVNYRTQERTVKPSARMLSELAAAGRITPELYRRYTVGRRYPESGTGAGPAGTTGAAP